MEKDRNQVFRVIKIVNNNIVAVKSLNGREMIAIGKGLGFKKMKNDLVFADEILKSYVLVDNKINNALLAIGEIPFEIVEVSQEIIDIASSRLNKKYNVNLLVNLSDHINFTINEYKKGELLPKLVNEEVKRFYREEYEVGLLGIKIINERFSIELMKDESTSIAFHLITNAENSTNYNTRKMLVSINDIISIVEDCLGSKLDEESLAYSRFVIHLKFFISTILNKTAIKNNCEIASIFNQLNTKYSSVADCVNRISIYIFEQFNYHCSDEDCIYLMIHIVRLFELTKGKDNE